MDPVLQIFQQQSSGSAGGEGFGGSFAQGRSFSLAERRLKLEQEQEARAKREQDAILPLEEKLMRYRTINAGLEAGQLIGDDAIATEINSALPKVNSLMMHFLRSPNGFNDSDGIKAYQQLYAQNPWVFSGGVGARIKQGMDAQLMQRHNWMQVLQHDEELKKRGQYVRGIDAKGGIDIGLIPDEKAQSTTTDIKNVEYASQLQEQINGLPDGPQKEALKAKLKTFQESTAPRGFTVRTNPDGTTEIIQGPVRDMTASQEGKLKEGAAYATDTARRIQDVKEMADTIFGPAAAAGEIVVDRALSNLVPELMNKERVRGREAARFVKEGIYRSLNQGQGPLTNKDIERLNKLYPALEGFDQAIESPARAKEVLGALQQQIARDSYLKTRMTGNRPDIETIRFLSPKFIREEFKAGRITEQEARSAINQSPFQDEINEDVARQRNGR